MGGGEQASKRRVALFRVVLNERKKQLAYVLSNKKSVPKAHVQQGVRLSSTAATVCPGKQV